jgi:hypothetical protein
VNGKEKILKPANVTVCKLSLLTFFFVDKRLPERISSETRAALPADSCPQPTFEPPLLSGSPLSSDLPPPISIGQPRSVNFPPSPRQPAPHLNEYSNGVFSAFLHPTDRLSLQRDRDGEISVFVVAVIRMVIGLFAESTCGKLIFRRVYCLELRAQIRFLLGCGIAFDSENRWD